MKPQTMTFAEIGAIFNDATTRLEGGISDQNRAAILKDLSQVQSNLTKLIANDPNDFQGVSGIHAQNIVDQLNLEVAAIKSVGSDPFAAKYINDVQRDLIDIVQGDDHLVALATQGGHSGFAAVPDLLAPPAQFQGSAEQVQFMQTFVTTTQSFADRAVALADHHAGAAEVQQLVGEVQAYAQTANTFTTAQHGLYSARFDNEFGANGVNGTATRALIDGLQTGNTDKVHAAAEVLVGNSADVASNMLGFGTAAATGNGIPDQITSFAQAGTVFNDATAKLIGGVYDGNRQAIHDDLTATKQGLQDMLAQGQFTGATKGHVDHIVGMLGKELTIVDNADAAPNASTQLHQLQTGILKIVQHDATLSTAAQADGATGFMQLPGTLRGKGNGQGQGREQGDDKAAAGGAEHVAGHHAPVQTDHLAHIFQPDSLHHMG